MNKDLHNNVNGQVFYRPAVVGADGTTTSQVIDLEAAGANSCDIMAFLGARTDGTFTLTVQDSDDNVTYAAVADEFLIGDPDENVLNTAYQMVRYGYIGQKQYLRLSVVASAVTSGALVGALFVGGNLTDAPSDTYYGTAA